MKRLIKASKQFTITAYHGTDKKFKEFKIKGDRLTSLGLGFYFTPNLNKAKQYGDIIMTAKLSFNNLLDWGNLTKQDREKIINDLEPDLSVEDIAGFGTIMEKIFTAEEKTEARYFYEEKVEETQDYVHDRAKARVRKDKQGNFIITWMEPSLESASSENLLALAQQYHNNIADDLGYDGAMYGDEIVVFDASNIDIIDYGWEEV